MPPFFGKNDRLFDPYDPDPWKFGTRAPRTPYTPLDFPAQPPRLATLVHPKPRFIETGHEGSQIPPKESVPDKPNLSYPHWTGARQPKGSPNEGMPYWLEGQGTDEEHSVGIRRTPESKKFAGQTDFGVRGGDTWREDAHAYQSTLDRQGAERKAIIGATDEMGRKIPEAKNLSEALRYSTSRERLFPGVSEEEIRREIPDAYEVFTLAEAMKKAQQEAEAEQFRQKAMTPEAVKQAEAEGKYAGEEDERARQDQLRWDQRVREDRIRDEAERQKEIEASVSRYETLEDERSKRAVGDLERQFSDEWKRAADASDLRVQERRRAEDQANALAKEQRDRENATINSQVATSRLEFEKRKAEEAELRKSAEWGRRNEITSGQEDARARLRAGATGRAVMDPTLKIAVSMAQQELARAQTALAAIYRQGDYREGDPQMTAAKEAVFNATEKVRRAMAAMQEAWRAGGGVAVPLLAPEPGVPAVQEEEESDNFEDLRAEVGE